MLCLVAKQGLDKIFISATLICSATNFFAHVAHIRNKNIKFYAYGELLAQNQ